MFVCTTGFVGLELVNCRISFDMAYNNSWGRLSRISLYLTSQDKAWTPSNLNESCDLFLTPFIPTTERGEEAMCSGKSPRESFTWYVEACEMYTSTHFRNLPHLHHLCVCSHSMLMYNMEWHNHKIVTKVNFCN